MMKALWTESKATVTGTYWQFKDVSMEPKPVQKPYPPVWFGGAASAGVEARCAARGWLDGSRLVSTADFVQQYGQLQRFLEEAKRDPATFAISKRVYLAVDNDRNRAAQRLRTWFGVRYKNADMASRVAVWGSKAECLDQLGELVKAGAQHLMLNPVFDEIEHVELLAQEIMPQL